MVWGFENAEKRLEVIAVVRDVKQEGPREESNLRFYMPYFAAAESGARQRTVPRTGAAQPDAVLAGVREAVRLEDRRLSITSVDVLADLANRVLVRERLIASLSAAFGTIAVLLAGIGLYGLIAHRVVRRTSEIGVRMAFGAARRDVLWMILRQALALVACGIAIGLPLARVAAALTRGVLFGISADDPATLVAASAALLAAGMLAGLVPAWRATRIEPVNAF